jgi:hypothetical protein
MGNCLTWVTQSVSVVHDQVLGAVESRQQCRRKAARLSSLFQQGTPELDSAQKRVKRGCTDPHGGKNSSELSPSASAFRFNFA